LAASKTSLSQADAALSTVSDLYGRVKELVTQAGDATLSASDKASISNELKGIRDQLVGLANQTDTNGRPLFGGLGPVGGSGTAFVEQLSTPVNTTYGPDGRAVVFDAQQGQVGATNSSVPAGLDGYDIFMGSLSSKASAIVSAGASNTGNAAASTAQVVGTTNPQAFDFSKAYTSTTSGAVPQGSYHITYNSGSYTVTLDQADGTTGVVTASSATTSGNSTTLTFDGLSVQLSGTPANGDTFTVTPAVDANVFESLDRVIGALDSNQSGADLAQQLSAVHGQMDGRLDQLVSARGKLGDWLNQADNMTAVLNDRSVAYQKENSDLTDVDMLKGVTDFQTNQTAYQAALQSYAQVQKMSMFNYLG
jgi:flagellar hook-associated protein 3 FlgL